MGTAYLYKRRQRLIKHNACKELILNKRHALASVGADLDGLVSLVRMGIMDPPVESLINDARTVMLGVVLMALWGGLGYWILIYTAGLRSIDPQLYESAMIGGAGFWRRTWHITVPLLRPVILFLSITGVIRAFQLFAIILILPEYGENAGGPDDATQVPILLIYQIAFGQRDFGYASALAVALFVILFVITLIQAKVGRLSQPT